MELRNESDIRWLIEKVAEKLKVNGFKYTVWNDETEEEIGTDGNIDWTIDAIKKEAKEGSIDFERDDKCIGRIHFIVVNNFCFIKELTPKVLDAVKELEKEEQDNEDEMFGVWVIKKNDDPDNSETITLFSDEYCMCVHFTINKTSDNGESVMNLQEMEMQSDLTLSPKRVSELYTEAYNYFKRYVERFYNLPLLENFE